MGIDKVRQPSIIQKKTPPPKKPKPRSSAWKIKIKPRSSYFLFSCCVSQNEFVKKCTQHAKKRQSFLCFLVSYITKDWFMVAMSMLRPRTSGNCEKERKGFGHGRVESTHSNKAMQSQDHLPLFLWRTLLSINTHLLWWNVQIKSFLKTSPSQLVEQCQ